MNFRIGGKKIIPRLKISSKSARLVLSSKRLRRNWVRGMSLLDAALRWLIATIVIAKSSFCSSRSAIALLTVIELRKTSRSLKSALPSYENLD